MHYLFYNDILIVSKQKYFWKSNPIIKKIIHSTIINTVNFFFWHFRERLFLPKIIFVWPFFNKIIECTFLSILTPWKYWTDHLKAGKKFFPKLETCRSFAYSYAKKSASTHYHFLNITIPIVSKHIYFYKDDPIESWVPTAVFQKGVFIVVIKFYGPKLPKS